jgi:pimeloyl-ACP methyl ester carboxylesterase
MNAVTTQLTKYLTLFCAASTLCSAFADETASFSKPDLPDAMRFLNGKPVETKSDWFARKAEIKKLWCDFFIGHYPSEVPQLLSAEIVQTNRPVDGSVRKRILLTFDTPNRKSFEIELWQPKLDGEEMPLLLTQPRNYQREKWGEEALRRGYMVCIYPGLDTHHREQDYPEYENVWKTFQSEYAQATWSSSLGIQAWLASRTLDYLLDPGFGYSIDPQAVGITGFSRYGKQSLYAAAFDERFKCVVARSARSPAASPYRFAGRETYMETSADFPDAWALPSLRGYLGRENELPVECNALIACIAPRHVMLDTAYHDGSDPTFAVERSYLNAKNAWSLLGKEQNICLSYRKGNHNPITDQQVQHNLDYFDMAFGRGTFKASDFPESLLHDFDWQLWKNRQPDTQLILPEPTTVRQKIEWILGESPTAIENAGEYHIKTGEQVGVADWSRDRWNPGGITRVPFSFSGKMHGNIFFDPQRTHYKATVIWLHPWNYSHGSNEGYGVEETTAYYRLAKDGYKVVMYDQFGFGEHLTDAVGFYDQHPHWSRLGRAVHDVRSVVDFLVDGKGITARPVPPSDPENIFVCGFAYGGMAGLYATALDARIKGVACFSGFTPMRTDTDEKSTGGIRRLWEWHALLPKLGLYHQREHAIPYDYDDVLAMIAGRECLIYAPVRDRFADEEDVKSCIESARASWAGSDSLKFEFPDDICRFQRAQQDVLSGWLDATTSRK